MVPKKTKKPIKALPFPVYFWTVAVLTSIGLADAVYLAISHYRIHVDIGYQSFCAISRAINCDTVSQSGYSVFLNVPVPIWGVVGYLFFGGCLFLAHNPKAEKKRLWAFLLGVSLVYSLCSIVLAAISHFYIHSYCIMCIVTYGVNFALVLYCWILRSRFGSSGLWTAFCKDVRFVLQNSRQFTLTVLPSVMVFLAAVFLMPAYWNLEPPPLPKDIARGVTPDGHPWIGAIHPELEIVEFSDYQCFQCKKMHYFLRRLVAAHPDRIRLIHRHYPMDHEFNTVVVPEPFHVGSGKLAMIAIYAATQGKFWVVNDALFDMAQYLKGVSVKKLSERTGLSAREIVFSYQSDVIRYRLMADIRAGMKLTITGTPGFLINGNVYLGQIPADILKPFL